MVGPNTPKKSASANVKINEEEARQISEQHFKIAKKS